MIAFLGKKARQTAEQKLQTQLTHMQARPRQTTALQAREAGLQAQIDALNAGQTLQAARAIGRQAQYVASHAPRPPQGGGSYIGTAAPSCADGSTPDPTTGLCANGIPPAVQPAAGQIFTPPGPGQATCPNGQNPDGSCIDFGPGGQPSPSYGRFAYTCPDGSAPDPNTGACPPPVSSYVPPQTLTTALLCPDGSAPDPNTGACPAPPMRDTGFYFPRGVPPPMQWNTSPVTNPPLPIVPGLTAPQPTYYAPSPYPSYPTISAASPIPADTGYDLGPAETNIALTNDIMSGDAGGGDIIDTGGDNSGLFGLARMGHRRVYRRLPFPYARFHGFGRLGISAAAQQRRCANAQKQYQRRYAAAAKQSARNPNAWNRFQTRVLPRLRSNITKFCGGGTPGPGPIPNPFGFTQPGYPTVPPPAGFGQPVYDDPGTASPYDLNAGKWIAYSLDFQQWERQQSGQASHPFGPFVPITGTYNGIALVVWDQPSQQWIPQYAQGGQGQAVYPTLPPPQGYGQPQYVSNILALIGGNPPFPIAADSPGGWVSYPISGYSGGSILLWNPNAQQWVLIGAQTGTQQQQCGQGYVYVQNVSGYTDGCYPIGSAAALAMTQQLNCPSGMTYVYNIPGFPNGCYPNNSTAATLMAQQQALQQQQLINQLNMPTVPTGGIEIPIGGGYDTSGAAAEIGYQYLPDYPTIPQEDTGLVESGIDTGGYETIANSPVESAVPPMPVMGGSELPPPPPLPTMANADQTDQAPADWNPMPDTGTGMFGMSPRNIMAVPIDAYRNEEDGDMYLSGAPLPRVGMGCECCGENEP